MAFGVYTAQKKDGTIYYRANIHYQAKHVSLGSYATQSEAAEVYTKARALLADPSASLPHVFFQQEYAVIPYDKIVILLNFRENGM